jgi:FKBP-type peptidyl-prolyl cis-trans isomerase
MKNYTLLIALSFSLLLAGVSCKAADEKKNENNEAKPEKVAPENKTGNKTPAQPKTTTKQAEPKTVTKTVESKETDKTADPKATTKPADPKATTKPADPKATTKPAGPKMVTKPADPKKPTAKPGDIPAPADVAAPPADAAKTASGLASKVLKAGTSTKKPTAGDTVKVHYTGWTTDGKMFDSSVKRGQPTTFPLGGVIKGWTEGLQLMAVGEKRRFWIPVELAYKNKPGMPKGMLVFDVELLSILEPAKAPADAAKTASGLATKVITAGTGKEKPTDESIVKIKFSSKDTFGKPNVGSRGKTVPVPLKQIAKVFPGFAEGLKMMVKGETRRMWIPKKIGLKGPRTRGMVIVDATLVDIAGMPKAPADVKAPPKDAKKTASGLAYKILKKGTGKENPTDKSVVTVNYTGWTTDGKAFDSSVARGKPATFPIRGLIKGWQEGLKLLVQGDSVRLWIPKELAYNGAPDKPAGMLVFDMELVKFTNQPPRPRPRLPPGHPGAPGGSHKGHKHGPGGHKH